MSGREQRYHFVTKLLVRHRRAIFISRFHQHRQQIVDASRCATPFRDYAIYNPVNMR
jgi:hypothetical protein